MFILSTLLHQLAKTNAGFHVRVFVTRKSWWVVLRGKPGGIFSKDVATWVWTVLTGPRIPCSFLKMFYPIAGHIGTILATLSLSWKFSKTCLFGGFWLSKSRVAHNQVFLGGLGRSLEINWPQLGDVWNTCWALLVRLFDVWELPGLRKPT